MQRISLHPDRVGAIRAAIAANPNGALEDIAAAADRGAVTVVLNTGEPKREPVANGSEKTRPRSRSVDSEHLFSGAETLRILHQGVTYTLRKTRNGKLILNK